MYALIALAVILLGAVIWRPFMRIIRARPSRASAANRPPDETLKPFLVYLVGAIFVVVAMYFVVVLVAGSISGISTEGGNIDYELMMDWLKIPFRF